MQWCTKSKTRTEADPSLCQKQTVDLDKGNGGYPLFFQMALQQSSSLLLLADSRRTSLLALHIRGPNTSLLPRVKINGSAVVNALDEGHRKIELPANVSNDVCRRGSKRRAASLSL